MSRLLVQSVLIAVLVASCGGLLLTPSPARAAETAAVCDAEARKAAMGVIAQWHERAGHADAAALAALYAEDAVLTTATTGEEFRGRAAIGAHLAGLLARHPMGHIAEAMTMTGCDHAKSTGQVLLRVTGRRKGTRMLLAGHYALSLAAHDGQWLIERHELHLNGRPNRVGR